MFTRPANPAITGDGLTFDLSYWYILLHFLYAAVFLSVPSTYAIDYAGTRPRGLTLQSGRQMGFRRVCGGSVFANTTCFFLLATALERRAMMLKRRDALLPGSLSVVLSRTNLDPVGLHRADGREASLFRRSSGRRQLSISVEPRRLGNCTRCPHAASERGSVGSNRNRRLAGRQGRWVRRTLRSTRTMISGSSPAEPGALTSSRLLCQRESGPKGHGL